MRFAAMDLHSIRTKLLKLSKIALSRLYLEALVRGRVAAAVEHTAILRSLDCRTVVDVGANRGQFALVARRCFPDARIISFEPLAAPAEVFASVFAGDSRTQLHRAAIGPKAGQATIHVSRRDDSSSLLAIGEMQAQVFPGTEEATTAMVQVGRLSDFVSAGELDAAAMLKIDVQGFELEALQGCEGLLDKFAYIYAECSFVELYTGQALAGDVIDWLCHRGFALSGIYNVSYDELGRSIQADFLFSSSAPKRGI
jgi:FkbM family methyltransferase